MSELTTGFADPPAVCARGHQNPKWMPGWRPCSCDGAWEAGLRGHRTQHCVPCLNGGRDTVALDPPCTLNPETGNTPMSLPPDSG